MHVLLNHLGFLPASPKRAIVQQADPVPALRFAVVETRTRRVVHEGTLRPLAPVSGWRGRHFAAADFDAVTPAGTYVVVVDGPWPPVQSAPFEIGETVLGSQVLSDIVHYFKSQRCTGRYDAADRAVPLIDSREPRDVHGGWYDASGDCSKYLSHLSYANFMNPQQTPLVTWTLLAGRDRIPPQSTWFDERIVDEALHGADFLLRMLSPEGFFHATVFDRWSKDERQREICSFSTQQGVKSARYRAGFRQGGGLAIAALARAAGAPRDGDATRGDWLAGAIRAFDVLQAHNVDVLDDHRENLLDDACALLAAAELLARTGETRWREACAVRTLRIAGRQDARGFWWCDDARTRSFFHASDAGLPALALARFVEVAPDDALAAVARESLRAALRFDLEITRDTPGRPNPFGVPRQFVALAGRAPAVQFFMPHDNESGYWWQGENARLASLAAAARAARGLHLADAAFDEALDGYARRALDWILGANPFDTCMLQGHGQRPPRYEPGFWNAPGGVCNGITSGLHDEQDIDFRQPGETDPANSWRWTEQWLPHAAWLFCALSFGHVTAQPPPAAFAHRA